MGALALGARIVLAAAFSVAAVTKLGNRPRVVDQMDGILGARAGPVAAVVVPTIEIVLAAGLVLVPSQTLPAALAVVVLLGFTGVLVWAQARRVPCPCFGGGASARPVGPAAIVRNGVLLALAVLGTGSIDGASVPATCVWIGLLGAVTAACTWVAR